MRNRIRNAAVLSFILAACAFAQDLASKFDEYLTAHVRTGRFRGSVLVAQEGKVVFARGYGMANREHNAPNTPQTKFRLGSITKQFTALAILQLQEKGLLSVEDPVKKHLPDVPASWDKITIHHLLTHTSGIFNFTALPEYRNLKLMPGKPMESLAKLKDRPLDFEPGEKFRYSNSGYLLLGAIIEKITGKGYADYMRENVFQPLKMNGTGYDNPREVLANRAAGYAVGRDGVQNAAYIDMTIPHGAGALYSTVEDLYLWNEALYTEKLVSKKSLEAMFTPFKDGYAYGWGERKENNRSAFAHGGGIEGFATFIARYPAQRAFVVVLCNQEGSPANPVARDLAAILFGEKYTLPRVRNEIRLPAATLDAYVGEYTLSPMVTISITREGEQLMTQLTGQMKFPVFAESENQFFLKVVDAQLTFHKDASGRVTHLVLHQGGRDQKAEKQ